MCVCERDLLIVFGSADDGDSLWQHQLIRTVSVKVNAGEEGRLSGMSLNTHTQTHSVDNHTPTQHDCQHYIFIITSLILNRHVCCHCSGELTE